MKDGSAAAIYGSRGGSGVILITTKSGKAGRMTVEYNGSFALEQVANTIDVMTADEYRQLPDQAAIRDFGASTDWFKEVTGTEIIRFITCLWQVGPVAQHIAGRLTIRDAKGIAINSGFNQINGRFNLTQKALKDKATFTVNLSTTRKEAQYGFLESLRYAIISNPTMPVYNDESAAIAPWW